jgi:D-amino-acid dehydrogenase
MGGFLRLAGTLELSGLNHTLRMRRLENLTASARQYLDGWAGPKSTDDWVGLRPCTPDGMPMVGPAPGLDGLWIANGHAMLGLTLGPVTGKLLAEWILRGQAQPELLPLRPDRF